MRRKAIISCFFLFLMVSFGKSQIHSDHVPHQSIVVALICHDGILMAADSRSAFLATVDSITEKKGTSSLAYAYFDRTPKIFQMGNYLIGVSGVPLAGKYFCSGVISSYANTHPVPINITQSFKGLTGYIQQTYGVPGAGINNGAQYIIAGYEANRPAIYGFSASGVLYARKLGGAIESDGSFVPYLAKPDNIPLNCRDVAPLVEMEIKSFARDKKNHLTGGPVEIYQIMPNNKVIRIKTFTPLKFKTYGEMAQAILGGQLPVSYIYPWSRNLLTRALREGMALP